MKKEQIIEKLTELEIPFDPKAKTKDLLALLPEELQEVPKEESKKFVLGSLGYLGGRAIIQINEVEISGKKYNDVTLEDGTGYKLSDEDFEAQRTDEKGEVTHF